MRRAPLSGSRGCAVLAALLALLPAAPHAGAQQRPPSFRANVTIVSVDVIVRDREGNIVKGLTEKDFEIREDGQAQEIRTFSFQQIDDAAPAPASVRLLETIAGATLPPTSVPTPAAGTAAAAPVTEPAEPAPLRSEDVAGRRLVVLLFDTSSMEPEDVQRSVDSAQKYVKEQMSTADLIAVATVSSTLTVLTDFTGEREKVEAALQTLSWTEGTATPPPDAGTMATDEVTTEEEAAETSELDMFNNDVRLRVLRTLAEALAPIDQKKAIVYFSGGMQRSGSDNQVELRAAINAAVRSNVSIYSIDTRGLQAVVPGGDARGGGGGRGGGRGGRGGGLFSGRGVAQQFARLSASQDSLVTLSRDTGGRAFTDTNDFGEAFTRLRRDMSAYYLLGYSSTNTRKDGRFRRIQVRLRDAGEYRVEARAGYYADRDFAHTSRGDRETQMEEQLYAAVSATDLPVIARASYFRLAEDRYFVPVALVVPGSAVPVPDGKDQAQLDILGEVRDERGFPVGRIRQTMMLAKDGLADRQVLYQSAMTLPPGRFSVKVVVRENTHGTMGTFEAPVTVPQLNAAPLKVSSVVLSTQLQPGVRANKDNPLIRDGVQLLPNLTHVVSRDQKLFFYYEVYDPRPSPAGAPEIRTSLAFYRGKVKVFETPVVVRSAVDAADRNAALFQFEVPAAPFDPGFYTCQVNVIDEVGGTFAFPRLDLYVR
jgi:VWFA-related protein